MRTESRGKCVIVILDGLGDRPHANLAGMTPLQAADTPTMDLLASSGRWGQVCPVPDGQKPHTHAGVGLLFGLSDEQTARLSRGPVEAAGIGWELQDGDIAIRLNFATLECSTEGFHVLDRRAGRIDEDVDVLAGVLEDIDLGGGVRAAVRRTEQHRGVLRLAGPGLSSSISDTDPGNVSLPAALRPCEALNGSAQSRNTAQLVNRLTALAHERLDGHPVNRARAAMGLPVANGILLRGAGTAARLNGALDGRGPGAAVVAGCSTVLGLARIVGLEGITDERFTADVDTDLDAKVAAVLDALDAYPVVYLHVKAPDICAHDLDPVAKKKVLEQVDRALAPLLDRGLVIALSADHGTDSTTGWHINDPVPTLIGGRAVHDARRALNFSEEACASGPLGLLKAGQFLQEVLTAAEK